eukprot:TRINITY_DN66245_c0_g1_i6.p1 TRINITY_DN66245_c0_g1~~TRINITY_DN66245_c0_g1_i6.p1  ORF type:complete len:551 (-),score=-26.62 TRINITY_DN66245_c0_g1_i6:689-2341(-)
MLPVEVRTVLSANAKWPVLTGKHHITTFPQAPEKFTHRIMSIVSVCGTQSHLILPSVVRSTSRWMQQHHLVPLVLDKEVSTVVCACAYWVRTATGQALGSNFVKLTALGPVFGWPVQSIYDNVATAQLQTNQRPHADQLAPTADLEPKLFCKQIQDRCLQNILGACLYWNGNWNPVQPSAKYVPSHPVILPKRKSIFTEPKWRLIVQSHRAANRTCIRRAAKACSFCITSFLQFIGNLPVKSKGKKVPKAVADTLSLGERWSGTQNVHRVDGLSGSPPRSIWQMGQCCDLISRVHSCVPPLPSAYQTLLEFDVSNMFWNIQRRQAAFAVVWFFENVGKCQRNRGFSASNLWCALGKIQVKSVTFFPLHCLCAILLWAIFHPPVVLFDGDVWIQTEGICIGGILSSHICEIALLCRECWHCIPSSNNTTFRDAVFGVCSIPEVQGVLQEYHCDLIPPTLPNELVVPDFKLRYRDNVFVLLSQPSDSLNADTLSKFYGCPFVFEGECKKTAWCTAFTFCLGPLPDTVKKEPTTFSPMCEHFSCKGDTCGTYG